MQLWNKLPLNFGYWQSKYFGKLFVCSFFLSDMHSSVLGNPLSFTFSLV
ncbi:hypothetical protein T10_1462 [Trichinella papuae]|uniref:Uncharacterized protein n=1 Tax=Trichinella papuae TaxID=268474 RepID=A0A0V1LXN6_9BILA|nr:hypothetical protein T10_1462 [Trichinella papuae]